MTIKSDTGFSRDVLSLDTEAAVGRIVDSLRSALRSFYKRGFVVAISGGIDSTVSAALCVKAVGAAKVFGLLLPERDSSPDSMNHGKLVVEQLGIQYAMQDITPTLVAIGCYRWRDEAILRVFPDYDGTWRNKIVIAGSQQGKINYFKLVVETPNGKICEKRLSIREYLQIVAATSFKQRIRKTVEYFHSDRLNYAVVGTPNRLEYDQGFFVKNGDGSADVKPIAHLYKTQVYELAQYLDMPQEIRDATPTTDTYSLSQGQDEFYFALPYIQMDLALWAFNHDVSVKDIAAVLDIPLEDAQFVYADIETKRRTATYLHARPVLVDMVNEVGA